MAWLTLDDNRKIRWVIDQVISRRIEIRIWVQGEKTLFTSKIIETNHGSISSEIERRPELIIEKLFPEKGNSLIRSLPEVAVEFFINQNLCRCTVECIGLSSTPPHFGFIMSFPESLEIEEKRREERLTHETPEFISAELRLGKKSKRDKPYELNVLNSSKHGLGLIITTFLTSWSMIKASGTVSHITKIEDGKHKGCYLLGIDSREITGGKKTGSDPPEKRRAGLHS
jgi:hypothetical protein